MTIRRTHPGSVRRLKAAGIAIGMSVSLACCGSDDDPETLPTETTSTSTSPTPASSAWESNYTQKQLQAYEAALTRWETYEQRSEPIWAAGKVTPTARQLFKEYWVAWAVPLNQLSLYERVGDKVVGVPEVLWSRPTKVSIFTGGGISVTIQQCIDPSTIEVEHAPGTQVHQQKQGPYIRRISLAEADASSYRVIGLFDVTSGKKVKPCGK